MGEWLNIAEHFLTERVREGRGQRVALRLPEGNLTYAEVERRACRFASALRALGARQEERVVVALADSAELVASLFGILKLGSVAVVVNPALSTPALAAVLELARPTVVIASPDAAAGLEEAAASFIRSGGASAPVALVAERGTVPPGSDEFEAARTHVDDPAVWLFSGGTTGRPKAAVQRHGSFANSTERYAKAAMGWSEDDVTISVPKLYFGYAAGSNLLFPFAAGGSAVLFPEHPTAALLFEQIARHRPSILVNVPKMVAEMVGHPDAGTADLSSLRFATSAGEALPPSLHKRWSSTFGVKLYDGLGTAEMWHVFLSNQPGAVRPGSLGRAVPGFELAVRDEEGGDLEDGEVGRLWVRGDSLALGYWRDSKRSAEAFRGEWFVGGDMVWRDGDGFFHYAGRADDALKVGGKWLLPAEVEDCLLTHPAVSAAAVVGIPGDEGLSRPVAFVVPAGGDQTARGASPADPRLETSIRDHCLARLDAYKHPRKVFLLAEMPLTHLGKIDRAELRRRALGAGGAEGVGK